MKIQKLQIGTYQIHNIYFEILNGRKIPVAECIFIAPGWSKFDFKTRKINLGSLFNSLSIGPKSEYAAEKIQSLYKYMVQIKNMYTQPNPVISDKSHYIVEWDAYKPDNYDELINMENQLIFDLNQSQIDPELFMIAMDEIIASQEIDHETTEVTDIQDEQFDEEDF